MGPKTTIFNHGDKALNVSSFNLPRKNKQFKKEYQNRMKNDRVMPIRRSLAKVAVGLFWAESWLFWPHFLRYRLQFRFFFKVSVAQSLVTSATINIFHDSF